MEEEDLGSKAGGRALNTPRSGSRGRHQKETLLKTKSIQCHGSLLCARHCARRFSCIVSNHHHISNKRWVSIVLIHGW